MADLTFRNAEESDSEEVLRLLDSHLLGGRFIWEIPGGKDPRSQLRSLVETPDSEYGYEQATLAHLGEQPVGLFIGYPRELLRVLGPRTLSVLMRGRSPLAWPGLIRAHARLARVEPPFPLGCYVLRCLCAADVAIVPALLAECVAEAVEEECSSVVVNVYEDGGELERILRAEAFAEVARRPVSDRKLASRLGLSEVLQFRRPSGYIGEQPELEADPAD